MTAKKIEQALLIIILVGYFLVAGLFAIHTPAWQTPDEPAHYNYVAQVAGQGCCPQIAPGDWDASYLDTLKAAHFRADLLDELVSIQYEDHQPPLYYLLASLVYKLANGSLIALRLFSVLLGGVVVLSAYALGKALLPERPQIALGMAALVAFLPQHVAILASVNNDALGWALTGIVLWLTIMYVKDVPLGGRYVSPLLLGLLVGIGFVTKASTYFLAGLVLLALLLHWWPERQATSVRSLLRDGLLFAVPALLIGLVWWLRNFGVYGFPDFLGLRAHDLVVAGQPRTAERIALVGWGPYLAESLQTTFNSFWGQFGWMALPMPEWIYLGFLGLLLLAFGGLVVDDTFLRCKRLTLSVAQRNAWVILGATLFLAVMQYFYYNTEFLQLQGRYMFSGLVPFALLLALGVDAWRQWLLARWPWTRWLAALIFLPLGALDIYLLLRFIAPLLAP